jgi:hypothetical protein
MFVTYLVMSKLCSLNQMITSFYHCTSRSTRESEVKKHLSTTTVVVASRNRNLGKLTPYDYRV